MGARRKICPKSHSWALLTALRGGAGEASLAVVRPGALCVPPFRACVGFVGALKCIQAYKSEEKAGLEHQKFNLTFFPHAEIDYQRLMQRRR